MLNKSQRRHSAEKIKLKQIWDNEKLQKKMREPQQNENKTEKQNNHNARSHANVLLAEFSIWSSVARAATLTELRP